MIAAAGPLLCLVTPGGGALDAPRSRTLRLIEAAAAVGVDLVQIRERALHDSDLLRLCEAAVAAAAGSATRVVVNDRTDVAIASRAHGVHLRADSVEPSHVRSLTAEGFLIGVSVHSRHEAERAAGSGVDYLIAGTMYPTPSKPGATGYLSVGGLREMAAAVPVPVLAIGGITADKVGDIARAGATGVAAIRLFADLCSDDPTPEQLQARLRALVQRLRAGFVQGAR